MKAIQLLFSCLILLFVACNDAPRKYYIGVSQCSEDIWRYKQNRELVIGTYITDNVELELLSAGDNDAKQIEQIEYLINKGIDLLVVAPNSAESLTEVIDKAYNKGIPVIYFDRKTNSENYTVYMGADNYKVGHTMGQLIGNEMNGKGVVVEITGLKGSSAAIERHRGFTDAIKEFPAIEIISSSHYDWTEKSGEEAMEEILEQYHGHIDCIFGHNDRLALGARNVALREGMQDIRYYGVDALPTPGGGIELVQKGIFEATYIYPTQGIEVMRMAVRILNGEKVEKTHLFESSVVDKTNADQLMMQYKEQERVTNDIEALYGKLDTYFSQVNIQQKVIVFCLLVIIIVIFLAVYTYRSYIAKIRLNAQLKQRNAELQDTYKELEETNKQLEDMADARLVFFTNVGHQLRTPLTLISGPVEQLSADSTITGEARKLVEIMSRNMNKLTHLVDEILDFRKIGETVLEEKEVAAEAAALAECAQDTELSAEEEKGEKPEVLVVDDNADVRELLKSILNEKYHVTLAANGKEGLEAARRIVPDLIVSDVMMPLMDGLEMCRELKNDSVTSHIPVLMLTARTLEEQRVEGYAHGADAYITKPFSSHLLMARIENLLAIRRTLRNVFAANISGANASSAKDEVLDREKRQRLSAGKVSQVEENIQDDTFIMRLRDVIQKNLSDSDFSVERIGKEIGMSRVQLYRKTKAMTGVSPVELLRRSRVERGRCLLEKTDKTISEIAYEVGFSAPSYFTKCFKDEYGVSPAEIKK